MAAGNRLAQQLRKAYEAAEEELRELRERIKRVEATKADIGKLLERAGSSPPARTSSGNEGGEPQGTGEFAGLSASRAAERVLEDAGRPMHIRAIAEALCERGYGKKPADELRVSLYTTLYRRNAFVRLPYPKATFGLAKWGSPEAQAERLASGGAQGDRSGGARPHAGAEEPGETPTEIRPA